ncbi:hypothetical protein KGM_208087 [Danaus plexippus plexippus]|uniref:E3 ubiquitin-protein ligase RNF180-like n=1 Tax=Danaus plexippus plexippus TaxID=278856 RepID=A0A212FDF0_DANPL|nr:hypothetical protein KGM_208087 [Danaus plexippus plexippus]
MPNIEHIKCHKCRNILLSDFASIYSSALCGDQKCSSYSTKNFAFLHEDNLPKWIRLKIEEERWTRGKLYCENCGCKVGTFDFVSGRKCECGNSVLPPVHFISSQVDVPITLNLFQSIK